jgi:hypothetical protein
VKQFLIIILLFFWIHEVSRAQYRITTTEGLIFSGYLSQQQGDLWIIVNESGIQYRINKQSIKQSDKLYSLLITKDGKELKGHIFRQDSLNILFIDEEEKENTIKTSEVDRYYIDLDSPKNYISDTEAKISQSEEIEHKTYSIYNYRYPSVGLTLGTPGGWNAVVSYQFEFGGFSRLQIGGLDEVWGYQLNLGANLLKTNSAEINISASGGYISHVHRELMKDIINPVISYYVEDYFAPRDNWTYFGLSFDLNWHGVFVEFGYSFGDGVYKKGYRLFQAGYVYRFND